MFWGNKNSGQKIIKNQFLQEEDQGDLYQENDIFLPDENDTKVEIAEEIPKLVLKNSKSKLKKSNTVNDQSKIVVKKQILENQPLNLVQDNRISYDNLKVDIEKFLNQKLIDMELKIIKSISNQSSKEYTPFFINIMFSSKGNYCKVTSNFMEMNIGLLSDYDEEPNIYPFGNDTLSNFSFGKTVDLIFENFDNEKGIISGTFTTFNNKNVIKLPNNYSKIIGSFPCTIKYSGRI